MALRNMPLYVTRKTANGVTGDFSISPGLGVTIFLLVLLNIVGWSLYGLVELGSKAVSLLG